MIVVNEEYGVVIDPDTLTAGESRPGFYKVNLSPIEEQIGVLETAVDDLFNCLDPRSGFAASQPHREGALSRAGFVTMFMLGLTFGMLGVMLALLMIGGG
ncbi:MAG: tetrahydromethanopterin S-methyltransferase subunit MtrB [Candidatus Methanospirareceae archaeon]